MNLELDVLAFLIVVRVIIGGGVLSAKIIIYKQNITCSAKFAKYKIDTAALDVIFAMAQGILLCVSKRAKRNKRGNIKKRLFQK